MTTTISEATFQAQVIEAAHLLKWHHLHVRRSIGGKSQGWKTTTNVVGWPDLLLWHDVHGFLAVELKVGKNTATPEQLEVLDQLARAGARTLVCYPSDWDRLIEILQGKA